MSCAGCDDCTLGTPQSEEIPYEIHVTAGPCPRETLASVAAASNAKVILIHNYIGWAPPCRVQFDRLVSAKVAGSYRAACDAMNRIQSAMIEGGVSILRFKIETAPWHPWAGNPGPDQYFECHLEVDTATPDGEAALFRAAQAAGVYLSANPNKGLTFMATLRRHQVRFPEFERDLDAVVGSLAAAGFSPKRKIVEFTLLDSNIGHDAYWMGA